MENSILEAINKLIPPPTCKGHRSNSITSGPRGEVAILCGGGKLYYAPGGGYSQSNCLFQILLDNIDLNDFMNIEFISDFGDSKFLLWGTKAIAVVTIPSSINYSIEKSIRASHKVIARSYLSSLSASQLIVKCACHPQSNQHIVFLTTKGPLIVIALNSNDDNDVDDDDNNRQVYPLDIGMSYVSFCFGHSYDWLRWTILLISNEGQLYLLCPVIPLGLPLTDEIKSDMSNFLSQIDTNDGGTELQSVVYMDLCSKFIHGILSRDPLQLTAQVVGPLQFKVNGSPFISKIYDISILVMENLQVPVIAISTDVGEVCVCVLMEDVVPSWTPALESGLPSSPAPEVAVIELICLSDAVSKDSVSHARIGSEKHWRLRADPFLSYSLHVVGYDSCAAFLVSLEWLPSLANTNISNAVPNMNIIDAMPTTCVPVFLHEVESSASVALSGISILSDPFTGHFGLFRTTLGITGIVNLTVHVKLCKLQHQLEESRRGAGATNKGDMSDLTGLAHSLNSMTDKLLVQIFEGIKSAPTPSTSAVRADESDEGGLGVLSRAMGHLEKHTIQPLEEMSQRIQFRIDLLREVNDAQILFLEGGGESGAGLRGVILEARTRQQRSRERLSRLLEIFSEQKETAACILTESLILKSKVSAEEDRFRDDLKDSKAFVSGLQRAVEGLRRQAQALRLLKVDKNREVVSVPSSPYARLLVSPEKSPMKQVGWFSRRRIGGQDQARPAEKPMLLMTPTKATPQSAEVVTPLRTPLQTPGASIKSMAPVTTSRLTTRDEDDLKRMLQQQSKQISSSTDSISALQEIFQVLQNNANMED